MNTQQRDVQVHEIDTGTTVLRSRTWQRLKFEIEYGLQRGTTANSYVIQGTKLAVIDPPGESFSAEFLMAFQSRFDLLKVDYIILGHINPNRFATLKAFLALAPQVKIITSNPGSIYLRNILKESESNLNPEIMIIRGDETLDLGLGHCLEFIPTPLPRWPDEMCSYDPKTKVLFSDKFFGSHVCGQQVLDEGWAVYEEDRRYYFDCLMASQAQQVETALEKISLKSANLYATGHGPLVKYGLIDLTKDYNFWLRAQKQQDSRVALIYASAYGNTAILAQAIARGISKSGIQVECINAEATDPEQIKDSIDSCSGFIFGSPTLGGHMPTPVQTALGIALGNSDKTKIVGVFGSYGWSGEAIDILENKFKDAGYRFGFETIRVKFKPDEAILKICEEAGTDFAQSLKKMQRSRKARGSVVDSQTAKTEQALGRIVGSLCIVTCQQGEIKGAMVASWVTQATFNPPGITVAVAKERAVESLLHKGDSFVVNILAEGQYVGLMKHFLKSFAPGEDRFVGVDIATSDKGHPILNQSLAYLECQVQDRMECGDHWLIYATTEQGKVLGEGITAIHHRKSGTFY
ncbi:MAG: diflavin flavoprotein [Cyanobacteriota bacterium ELA615]